MISCCIWNANMLVQFLVIYQTRERVFHQDIQTPRGGLKK